MRAILVTLLTLLVATVPPAAAAPLGTSFTYQGRLDQAGVPLDGTADFEFRLFDAPSSGLQIGATVTAENVAIVDGWLTTSLNFGSAAFSGDARWLEIAVRSPGGGGAFTALSPRQALTGAPYALQTRGLFVDSSNRVGIGTTTPSSRLSLGNALTNSKLLLWDDGPGTGMGLGIAAGQFRLHVNQSGDRFSFLSGPAGNELLTVAGTGNVGVGTSGPAAKLDVRGDVKLGPSGQYFAPAGQENLRMVRGTIDQAGNVIVGSGFTVSHGAPGTYTVTFQLPFAGIPSVTATPEFSGTRVIVMTDGVLANSAVLKVFDTSGNLVDAALHLGAIGPR